MLSMSAAICVRLCWSRPPAARLSCPAHSAAVHVTCRRATQSARSFRKTATRAETLEFRAQCHPGLEEVVAAELRQEPIRARRVNFIINKAGVDFSGTMETAYQACIRLRAALRVLHLVSVKYLNPNMRGYDELYAAVRASAPWHEFLGRSGMTLGVQLRMRSCEGWNHSTAAQQCIQDAICDAVRDHGGTKPLRPSSGEQASLQLFVTMFQEEVKIYRDVSGTSLHRRGYRSVVHKAALNEAAAAGLLYMAGWPALAAEGGKLVDCMCGSGTILTEAALMAHKIAPGLLRQHWSLTEWHDYDSAAWQKAREQAEQDSSPGGWRGVIAGCDTHAGALTLASQCLEAAGVADSVHLHQGSCSRWHLPGIPDIVVTNPPWGVRLGQGYQSQNDAHEQGDSQAPDGHVSRGEGGDAGVDAWGAGTAAAEQDHMEAWSHLSTFLKRATAWILCGDKSASRALRMKVSRRHPVTLGGIDCRLLKYSILPPRKEAAVGDGRGRGLGRESGGQDEMHVGDGRGPGRGRGHESEGQEDMTVGDGRGRDSERGGIEPLQPHQLGVSVHQ